jgi:hypothetical protein
LPIESPYPGIKTWKSKAGDYRVLRLHYEADPDKWLGEHTLVPEINKRLSPWALAEYSKLTDKSLYLQEYEIDANARQGARLFNFDDEATLALSTELGPIPHEWTRWHGLDPHPRVPHAHLWCAVDPYGDRWYYREFWPSKIYGQPGNIPEDDNRYKIKEYCEVVHYLESGENPENGGKPEVIHRRVIDYAARAMGQGTVDDERQLNFQERYEKISREIGQQAGNSWRMRFVDCVKDRDAGIELVNEGLKPLQVEIAGEWKKRSRIHIFADKCPELVYQLRTNRYPKLTPVQADSRDPIATPMQKRNHCTDLIRYIEMDKPRFIPRNLNVKSDFEPLGDGVNY